MRKFLIIATVSLSAMSMSALAAERSPGEIAWGKKANACLQTKHANAGCYVTPHPDGGHLTIWCPKGTDQSIPNECEQEADEGSRPVKWEPEQ